MLCNGKSVFCSAISLPAQVNFQYNEGEVRFVLKQHPFLTYHSACSLKQQSVNSHYTPLGHIILIPSQLVCSFTLMWRFTAVLTTKSFTFEFGISLVMRLQHFEWLRIYKSVRICQYGTQGKLYNGLCHTKSI